MEFNESAWTIIDLILPDDVQVRKYVLNDLIWFFNKPRKKKDTAVLIEEYIHHLELKASSKHFVKSEEIECFQRVDIDKIKNELIKQYKK